MGYGKEIEVESSPNSEGEKGLRKISLTEKFGKMYTGDMGDLFIRIDKSSLNLALYLCHHYGDNGEFVWGGNPSLRFSEWLEKKGCVPYHRMTMDRSLKELVDEEFVLRLSRGQYAINPKYFYKGDDGMRVERMKSLYKMAMDYKRSEEIKLKTPKI